VQRACVYVLCVCACKACVGVMQAYVCLRRYAYACEDARVA